MGKLQVLPPGIANMIAAGEVVQRPSSVVKELVENAVDAGATQVSVVIADSGRTLIQVIDNGCGMSPEDALLCFERHATSKIASAEDLGAILTYGFRGEALASIAAVSEISLKTRRSTDEVCTEVRIGDGGRIESSLCAGPAGSNFAVRNLFYNTPARRKFLKSDNVEFRHIVEEFTRIALINPEIGFSLSHNGRDVFVLRKANSLKFRILDLLGTNVVGDVVDLESTTSAVTLRGFVGRPQSAKKTLGNQYFFVNGRFFKSAYLHKAVMKAYEEMLPEGLTPSYFIFLETDPHSVDVNIHPTKTEVKFEDEQILFQILYASVRETLGRNCLGASIDFDREGAVEIASFSGSFQQFKPVPENPEPAFDPSYDPFAAIGESVSDFQPVSHSGSVPSYRGETKKEDYGVLFEERELPKIEYSVLGGKYIVFPSSSGLMLVHIRRALERIIYEKTLRTLSSETHITQRAIFPVHVRLNVAQRMLFDDNAGLLQSLGFEISPEGDDTVVVEGVPEGYSCEEGKVEEMISNLTLILSEDHTGLKELMTSEMASKFATLGAVSADKVSSPAQARELVDTLFASENAEFTPNGRRIIARLLPEDIEKLF